MVGAQHTMELPSVVNLFPKLKFVPSWQIVLSAGPNRLKPAMNKRTSLILLALVATGSAAGIFWWKARREAALQDAALRETAAAARVAGMPYVTIQDGRTIDFSSGRPEVRDTSEDRAAIKAAVMEIDAAVKNVTFAPIGPADQSAK
jgi:hypothetical protein